MHRTPYVHSDGRKTLVRSLETLHIKLIHEIGTKKGEMIKQAHWVVGESLLMTKVLFQYWKDFKSMKEINLTKMRTIQTLYHYLNPWI